jgi:hypothetical protein
VPDDAAFVRLKLAADQAEQCRLAGTVGTDEADFLTFLDLPGYGI